MIIPIDKKIINLLSLLIIVMVIIGCTPNQKQKDVKDNFYSSNCTQFEDNNSHFWWDTKIIEEPSLTHDIFYESYIFSGIKSVQLYGSILHINIINKEISEEYTAPVINRIKQKIYKNTGCIQNEIIESKLIKHIKTKTGKVEYKDTETIHKILVSGFDKEYEFTITNKSTIDLKSAILNSKLSKQTTLNIFCLDCIHKDNTYESEFNFTKKSNTLTFDFNNLKQKYEQEEKQKLISAQEIEKKNADLEKIKLKAEKIKQGGVPLDEFENKCIALDFKKGTKDFGDCVLKLNEMK
jgi:hypothetical protein